MQKRLAVRYKRSRSCRESDMPYLHRDHLHSAPKLRLRVCLVLDWVESKNQFRLGRGVLMLRKDFQT